MIMRAGTTNITSTEFGQHALGGRALALAALSVAVTLGASTARAAAEVSIHGDRTLVHLEASNAPISEVLSALETGLAIRHRTSVPLDQAISGGYSGSLRRVLSRVLDGFNYYVADMDDGRIEITVIGRPGAAPVAGNLPSAEIGTPQATAAAQLLVVPPPTAAEVAAERQRLHHRRPP
jgi:hypothetical protein